MAFKIRHKALLIVGFWLLAVTCCAAHETTKQAAQPVAENPELIRVKVYQLMVDPSSRQPVVTLADSEEKRALFIWVGLPEARAIYSELEGVEHPRPLTHDLLGKIILKTKGQIRRIVVTHSSENIYFATIVLQTEGNPVEIDARPSDALVMALKFNAPVYVARDLFDKMSLPLESRTDMQDSYGLSLQELTPELAKYLSYESQKGIMVSGVRAGSQAEIDGLKAGDIIVKLQGRIVEDLAIFFQTFKKSNTPLEAEIFRDHRLMTLTVHPE